MVAFSVRGKGFASVTKDGHVQLQLPVAIGKPATNALLGAGLTTLALVAGHTRHEQLALHGVGPKAVRILADALAEQGMSLR